MTPARSILAALIVAACASFEPAMTLKGSAWRAQDIDHRAVLDGAQATLEFRDGGVLGSTGCNRYFAPVTLIGNRFAAGQAATTRMACSTALMEQERRFLESLAAARTYRVEGDLLYLVDERGVTRMRLARGADG